MKIVSPILFLAHFQGHFWANLNLGEFQNRKIIIIDQ